MLRSSPIICLIDNCYMLCRFLHFYCRPKTEASTNITATKLTSREKLRQSHLRLLRLRYQPWDPKKADEDDVMRMLQHNKTYRLFAFMLLVVQSVKFFAYEGLYWSKAIVGLYLASFITVELLTIWPRGDEFERAINDPAEREAPIKSSGSLSLPYISVALAVVFLSFFGASFIRDAFNQSHGSLLRHLGTVTFFSWILAFLFAYGMCIIDGKRADKVVPTTFLVPVLGIPWLYYGLGPRMAAAIDKPLLVQVLFLVLGVVWVAVGVKYASAVTRLIRKKADNQDESSASRRVLIEKFLAWYFVLLHLLTAVLYLRFSYDPVGTSAPSWTKWLG